MTDKYCPLRFREFGSQPHDQRCIGEYCAWYDKCSQSHGEPRTDTVETQTRVRTETDTETAQEPREVDENANDVDTREKLEADVEKLIADIREQVFSGREYNPLKYRITNLLDRQAAITERETKLRELYRFEKNHRGHIDSIEEVNRELNRRIAELQECWAQEAREHADDSAILVELAHENAELKREIAELQAKVNDLESLDDDLLDKYLERGEKITELQAEVDELYKSCDILRDKKLAAEREKSELQTRVGELEKRLAGNARHPFTETILASLDSRENELKLQEKVEELERENEKLSSDELHWRSESEFWRCKYELIAKAVRDVMRNYVDIADEGMA